MGLADFIDATGPTTSDGFSDGRCKSTTNLAGLLRERFYGLQRLKIQNQGVEIYIHGRRAGNE
jgi:hypothetical protein